MTRKIWIDTDVGTDDAIAIIMAMRNVNVQVVGISTCHGNTSLDNVVQNALYIRDLCNYDVPIFTGAEKPLRRSCVYSDFIHGEDGLGDLGIKLKGRIPSEGEAHRKLIEALKNDPGQIELVCLGPLTNIAIALQECPQLFEYAKHTYVMGGLVDLPGNITPLAEFNIWADPEAASISINNATKMTIVGWDTTLRSGSLSMDELEQILNIGGQFAKLTYRLQNTRIRWMKENDMPVQINMADPLAMAVVLEEDLIKRAGYFKMTMNDDQENEVMRGFIEVQEIQEPGPIRFVHEVDRNGFLNLLNRSLQPEQSNIKIYPTSGEKEIWTDERCFITEILNSGDYPNVSLAKARVEPGVETQLHSLSNLEEVYYIIKGIGDLTIDGQTKTVTVGNCIPIGKDQSQKIKNTGQEDLEFLCICHPRFTPNKYKNLES